MFDENSNAVGVIQLNHPSQMVTLASPGATPTLQATAASSINSNQIMGQLMNVKDSRWLQLEVCREFQRGQCSRSDLECKFAHPPPHVDVQNGRVTACYDSIKGRCTRENPKCKYLHPPHHLKDQLLVNGKHNLALKNLIYAQIPNPGPTHLPMPQMNQFVGLQGAGQPGLVQPFPYQCYPGLAALYHPSAMLPQSAEAYAAVHNSVNAAQLAALFRAGSASGNGSVPVSAPSPAVASLNPHHPAFVSSMFGGVHHQQLIAAQQAALAAAVGRVSPLTNSNGSINPRKRPMRDDASNNSSPIHLTQETAQNQLLYAAMAAANATGNGIPCKRQNLDNKNCNSIQASGTPITQAQPAPSYMFSTQHQPFNPYMMQPSIQGFVPAVTFAGQLPPRGY